MPIVALYGPTLPVRSAPWRSRSLVTESVEIADLACRPCDQRVCAPGDFRCLTRISPERGDRGGRARARPVRGCHDGCSRQPRRRARHRVSIRRALASPRRGGRCSSPSRSVRSSLAVAVACWVVTIVRQRERVEVPLHLLAAHRLRGADARLRRLLAPAAQSASSTASSWSCSCSCR